MLRPTGMDTLATELWSRTSVGAYAEAAPYALHPHPLAAVPACLHVARHDAPRRAAGGCDVSTR